MADVQSDVLRGASVTEASEMVSSVVPTIAWAGGPRQVELGGVAGEMVSVGTAGRGAGVREIGWYGQA